MSLFYSNASMVEYRPSFTWSLGSLPRGTQFDHSQIQVSSDQAFSTPVIDQALAGTSTLRFIPTTDLSLNTQYYWRVRTFNTDNEMSSWSDIHTFKTQAPISSPDRPVIYSIDPNLPAPEIISPTDQSMTNSLRPVLDWTDVTGASSYIVQVSTDANITPSTFIVSATTVQSEYTFLHNVPTGTTLYWRVLTINSNKLSNWSSVSILRVP